MNPDSVLNESLYGIVRYADRKPLQVWLNRRRPGLPREQSGCTTAPDAIRMRSRLPTCPSFHGGKVVLQARKFRMVPESKCVGLHTTG